jgi:hypothetical protein
MVAQIRRMTAPAAMLVLPLAVIGMFARDLRATAATAQASLPQYIDSPTQWVPFEADVTITHPGGEPIFGRYFRSSNGSHRLETGPNPNEMLVVSITNIPDSLQYVFGHDKWTRQPGPGLAEFGTPPRWRKTPQWSLYGYKLAIQRGQSGSATASDGWEAYRVISGEGVMRLKVPALNLFDALIQRPDGRYEVYKNVDLREPPAELFRPPSDAIVIDVEARPPSVQIQR